MERGARNRREPPHRDESGGRFEGFRKATAAESPVGASSFSGRFATVRRGGCHYPLHRTHVNRRFLSRIAAPLLAGGLAFVVGLLFHRGADLPAQIYRIGL